MMNLLPDSMRASAPFLKRYAGGMLIWSVIMSAVCLVLGYRYSFLWMQRDWGMFFDLILPHATHLADGAMVGGVLGMVYAVKKPSISLSLLISLLFVSLVIAILKNGIFPDWNRPASVFGEGDIRLLSLGNEKYRSFPSGHSAAAACLGWFGCLLFPARWWAFFTLALTIFMGWTRVYLGVHFPADVAVGLVVGLICAGAGSAVVRCIFPSGLPHTTIWRKVLFVLSFCCLMLGIFHTIDKYYLPL